MGALLTVCSAMPVAIRDVALPLVERWAHVLPSWVGEIKIEWDEKDTECNARIWVSFEYRRVVLSICSHFMSLPPDQQSHTILHEICHSYTTPIAAAAIESVQAIVGAESTPGSRLARVYLDERSEGCTEDLTRLVERLMLQAKGPVSSVSAPGRRTVGSLDWMAERLATDADLESLCRAVAEGCREPSVLKAVLAVIMQMGPARGEDVREENGG